MTGDISPRRAVALIKQLPTGSRFAASQRGGAKYVGWDVDRYMRAALIDAVNNNTFAFIMANTDKKKAKPKAPTPVLTPDAEDKAAATRKAGSNAFEQQMNAVFNRLKANEAKPAAAPPPRGGLGLQKPQ